MKNHNISDTVNALTLDQLEYHLICSCLPQVDDYASEAQAREHLIQHLEEEREFFSRYPSSLSNQVLERLDEELEFFSTLSSLSIKPPLLQPLSHDEKTVWFLPS